MENIGADIFYKAFCPIRRIEFKDALERFFYLYMPTINKFKQTLRGDFGDDIGTPPNLNFKIDILDLDCFNRLKFQTMIEIYSSSAT